MDTDISGRQQRRRTSGGVFFRTARFRYHLNDEQVAARDQIIDDNFCQFQERFQIFSRAYKVGCFFSMVAVSIPPYAEFGSNDYREDAAHFNTKLGTQLIEINDIMTNEIIIF